MMGNVGAMGAMGMMGAPGWECWGLCGAGSELDYACNVSLATVNFVRIRMEICPGLLC